jgi:hypothetical protein
MGLDSAMTKSMLICLSGNQAPSFPPPLRDASLWSYISIKGAIEQPRSTSGVRKNAPWEEAS